MTAGVPQGSALSPLLFNLFSRDLPQVPDVNLAMYADDVCIFTRSRRLDMIEGRLLRALEEMETWYRTWRIRIHPEKSTAMLFSRTGQQRRRGPYCHGPRQLKIFGGVIPWKKRTRYLGVTMDTRLSWGPHIQQVTTRARQMTAAFYGMLNRRSKLNPARKIQLYKTVIRPTMTYASAVWATAAACHMRKLQVVQNRVLRMALDAPWFVRNDTIHRDIAMESIPDFIRRTAEKIFNDAANHPNPLVREAVDYDPRTPRRFRRPRAAFIP